LHVLDGRTICIAYGATPSQWLRVSLRDVPAGTPRQVLLAAVFAKEVTCRDVQVTAEGVSATCSVNGATLAAATQSPIIRASALAWR
jgi:hypothetical protein